MFKFIQIENVGFVDDVRTKSRLWANFVLIDEEVTVSDKHALVSRQIRGFTNGGVSVFTYWIDLQAKIEFTDNAGGSINLLRDTGEIVAVDSGLTIKVNDLVLVVAKEDYNQPIKVTPITTDRTPYGEEVDKIILKYYNKSNYWTKQWTTTDFVKRNLGISNDTVHT